MFPEEHFPQEVFFILEGTAAGIREYADGNEYSYFQLDKSNGSIGLLELFARKDRYVATIVSLTKMKLMKINSEVVYGAIMEDVSLLRRCTVLLADDLYQRSGNDGILYYFQGIDRVRYYLTSYYEEHKAEQTSGKVIGSGRIPGDCQQYWRECTDGRKESAKAERRTGDWILQEKDYCNRGAVS